MLDELISITQAAHATVLEVYNSDFFVETKSDKSPVTDADRRAHDVIVEGLMKLDRSIPIISEEGSVPSFETRRCWKQYWLVDPIDGTREFAKKCDEFTVNIALIEQGQPTMGVVGVPTQGTVYSGDVSHMLAFRHSEHEVAPIATKQLGDHVQMILSRNYTKTRNQYIIDHLRAAGKTVEVTSVGSSLKMCYIAEGKADIYVRLGPTNEWDIAAAHAILNAAGGGVYLLNGQSKVYNLSQSLLNPDFFVCGSSSEQWTEIIAASKVLAKPANRR